MWQECLSSASLIPLAEEDLKHLAESLCGDLSESKKYYDAALIQLDYLSSTEVAAQLLCKGYLFSEAIRVVVFRQESKLLSEIIDPALVEASGTMTETLAEIKNQINAQVPRIQELRAKKAEDPCEFLFIFSSLTFTPRITISELTK